MVAAALLFASACEQADGPSVEYQPGEAGTVDHALCLLGFAAIPLEEVATGHHLVQARINGTQASFVLDTGANMTVVDTAQAGGLGVSAGTSAVGRGFGRAAVPGAGGRARQVAIETFAIGSVPIRQNRIVTSDLAHLLTPLGRIAGEEVVGIIGQDVLKEHRATIDVAGSMLYLMAADEDPSPVHAEACRGIERESESVT